MNRTTSKYLILSNLNNDQFKMNHLKALFIFSIILISCSQTKKVEKEIDYVIISASLENYGNDTLKVGMFDYSHKISSRDSSHFLDTVSILKNGYHEVSIGYTKIPLYLTMGETMEFSLDVDDIENTLTFSGGNANENNLMAKVSKMYYEITGNTRELFSLEEQEFLKKVNSTKIYIDDYINGQTEVSDSFKKQQLLNEEYSMLGDLNNYEMYHAGLTKNTDFKVTQDFEDQKAALENQVQLDLNDEKLFKISQGYRELVIDQMYNRISDIYEDVDDYSLSMRQAIEEIQNSFIKNEAVNLMSSMFLSPNEELEGNYQFLLDNSTSQNYNKEYTEVFNELKKLAKGQPSPQFVDYEDHKGGTVSLNDLKGKYVYVDVWATWCGPCVAEIPSLKEVEKTYHGKNIEFVSTSVDNVEDHDKWKDFVKERHLEGIQLISDNSWDSDFVMDYGIQGIPRFILVDPDGNIVSADAPRPSSPKLTELLKSLNL